MKKTIFNAIGLAVIAALLCVTCGDNGLDRSPTNNGDVDGFLDRIHEGDDPPDKCAADPVNTPDCPGYNPCAANPTAAGCPNNCPPTQAGCPGYVDPNPTCPSTQPGCPGYPTTSSKYCYWAPNLYNDYTGACVEIGNPYCGDASCQTESGCTTTSGEVMSDANCGNRPITGNDPCASGPTSACCAAQPSYPGCPSTPVVNVYCRYGSATACSTIPDDQMTKNACTADGGFVVTSCSATATAAECAKYNNTAPGCSAPTQTKYTVTFNSNGGTGTAPAAQTVNAGSYIMLPSGSGLTMTGYTFQGWSIDSYGYGTIYSAGSTYTPSGSVMLYAVWNTSSGTVDNSLVSGANQAWIAYYIDNRVGYYDTTEQNFGFVFKANGQMERIVKNNTWTCSGTGTWYVEGSSTSKYVYIIADNSYNYSYNQFSTGLGKRLSAAATGTGWTVFIKKTGTWPSCSNTGNPTNPCDNGPSVACCAYNSSFPGCVSTPDPTAKYCRWNNDPNECLAISPLNEEPAARTEANCRSAYAEVVSNCNVLSNFQYCYYYGSKECWALIYPNEITPYATGNNRGMTFMENCYASGWVCDYSDCRDKQFPSEYCSYGTCIGGSGYNCQDGGCFPGPCEDTIYGTRVSSCPAGTKPPDAWW